MELTRSVCIGWGFIGEHVDFWVIVGVCPMGKVVKLKIW